MAYFVRQKTGDKTGWLVRLFWNNNFIPLPLGWKKQQNRKKIEHKKLTKNIPVKILLMNTKTYICL